MPQEGVSSGNCKQANSKTTGARTTSGVIIKLDKFAGLNALPCINKYIYYIIHIYIYTYNTYIIHIIHITKYI